MSHRLSLLLRQPYAPLYPWVGAAAVLFTAFLFAHNIGVSGIESNRQRLESEWAAARKLLLYHREARKAKIDVDQVWAVLVDERDFAPLALGISEEAKRDRVVLPALSYKTEPTLVAKTSKGVLQGSMTGRYEDLRRFIYDLEAAEEPLFIEDLELSRAGGGQDQTLTFAIKIATYLRADTD